MLKNKFISIASNIPDWGKRVLQLLMLLFVLYVFMVSLEMMGASFKLFGKDFAKGLVATASNPFIGLFIGMLATAIIQSSSTTTSMVVALVAAGAFGISHDAATIAIAVPIIMGANIGTSVTSTIVALGHISNRQEYRKAVAAATVHDFFNILTVLILFPLEVMFGILSKPAAALAGSLFVGGGDGGVLNAMKFVKHSVKPVSGGIIDGLSSIIGAESVILPAVALIVALFILFISLQRLSGILKAILIGKMQSKVENAVFGNPLKAIAWGAGLTTLVQSSSVTSSLTVPLVATNKVSLARVFPFLIGANIGTTTTALIAALVSTTSDNPIAGLAIALCHVFFNFLGATVIFPIKKIRSIPINLARALGRATLKNRLVGVAYIAVTFFLIPFMLIGIDRGLRSDAPAADSNTESVTAPQDESAALPHVGDDNAKVAVYKP